MPPKKPTPGRTTIEPPKSGPNCPKGHGRMRYNTGADKFQCGDRDCNMEATPKMTAERLRDIVLTGRIELVKRGDEFFLHFPEQNVMCDVTAMVEDTGTGEVHGEDNKYSIMLHFPGIVEASNGEGDEED